MSEIGRNDLCPCGSGKKYKKCHGNQSGLSELSKDSSLKCICESGIHPFNCCGPFLSSSRRIKPSVRKSEFTIEGSYQVEYTGKVYFNVLSTTRREWISFRNFYLIGIEINGRFFRPTTLDFVLEMQTEKVCYWSIRSNLDHQTGALIKFQTLINTEKNKLLMTECQVYVSKSLNQIEMPYIKILNNRYLRLFHHTSIAGYDGIISSKSIWSSPYDLQGSTRELQKTHFAYFTDLPLLNYESDLFAVAMRDNAQAAFRTDDETLFSFVDIYKQPASKREKRLTFYIDINQVAPVPAIYHNQEETHYIEFFHPHIFRIGINPDIIFPIEQFEDGWIICNNSITPKMNDVFSIANGNSLSDLSKLYQDRYIEP